MRRHLDQLDEHILRLLRRDGRMPIVTLADTIGLSRSATQERLARLERAGTIEGYTIKLGASADVTCAWLLVRLSPGRACATLVPTLLERSEVRTCHSVAGDIDLIMRVEVADAAALLQLREDLAQLEGVASVITAPILRVHAE